MAFQLNIGSVHEKQSRPWKTCFIIRNAYFLRNHLTGKLLDFHYLISNSI